MKYFILMTAFFGSVSAFAIDIKTICSCTASAGTNMYSALAVIEVYDLKTQQVLVSKVIGKLDGFNKNQLEIMDACASYLSKNPSCKD